MEILPELRQLPPIDTSVVAGQHLPQRVRVFGEVRHPPQDSVLETMLGEERLPALSGLVQYSVTALHHTGETEPILGAHKGIACEPTPGRIDQ